MKSGTYRDAGIVQKSLAQGIIVAETLLLHDTGDVRIQVKGGIGPETTNPFNGIQNIHCGIAPLL